MTVRSRAQLNSDADTHLPNNTSGAISPEDVRQRVKDLADSAALPGEPQAWTKPQRSDITSLSVVSGDIDWTLASSNDFAVTLTASAELQLPSDIANHVGQNGTMLIKQDGTGSRTFAVASGFSVLNSDTLPDVLPDANAKTLLSYRVISTTEIVIAMGGVGDGL